MDELDLAKRDMKVIYGSRTFAVRAYRQSGAWRSVIIENRTPMGSWLEPTTESSSCLAAAVALIAATVDGAVASEKARG